MWAVLGREPKFSKELREMITDGRPKLYRY